MTHRARKRFGQNFLQDTSIIDSILIAATPDCNEHWVEIGPGQGALTAPLLRTGVKLDLIELDRDLVAYLTRKFANHDQLAIHSQDALTFDFSQLATTETPLHIIGNLPYNISTPLLFHLMKYTDHIHSMYFMLQKEVVERICAAPGSKRYGRLSIMLQYYCHAEPLFDVPPESFSPQPKVMSAIFKLTPHNQAPVDIANLKHLNQVVTQAFSQRRKTLRNSLKKSFTEAEISALDINPELRAEAISLAEFARLSNQFTLKNP
jgi:16S rRNA (adenine1518-N6/adenine1519-N6)-dimethyltransferase